LRLVRQLSTADDGTESGDQRGDQAGVGRSEGHPPAAVAQESFVGEFRPSLQVVLGPGDQREDPGADVGLGGREPYPVLEGIDGGERWSLGGDEGQARYAPLSQLVQPEVLAGPPDDRHVRHLHRSVAVHGPTVWVSGFLSMPDRRGRLFPACFVVVNRGSTRVPHIRTGQVPVR
jgi:hypothetical protein